MKSFTAACLACFAFLGVGGVAISAEIKATGGIGARSQYEGADEFEYFPAIGLKVSVDERYLLVEGLTARVNLINSLGFNFGPLFSWRQGRTDVDDPIVDLLRDVDGTFEAGLFASLSLPTGGYFGDWATFEVESLRDTGSSHDGAVTTFGVTAGKVVSPGNYAMLTLSATHASDNFADAYFGVDAADAAASGLALYNPGAGMKNIDLVGTFYYGLGDKWTLGTEATWSVLRGDFAASPIVARGSENQYRLILTVTRKF